MKENDIINALECCNDGLDCCKECPAKEYNVECGDVLKINALKLINRQKAELARLRAVQDSIDNFARDLCKERMLKGKAIADFEDLQEYIRKEKSEAIREFAEKLKERNEDFCVDKSDMAFVVDSIVKEMKEGENG